MAMEISRVTIATTNIAVDTRTPMELLTTSSRHSLPSMYQEHRHSTSTIITKMMSSMATMMSMYKQIMTQQPMMQSTLYCPLH